MHARQFTLVASPVLFRVHLKATQVSFCALLLQGTYLADFDLSFLIYNICM